MNNYYNFKSIFIYIYIFFILIYIGMKEIVYVEPIGRMLKATPLIPRHSWYFNVNVGLVMTISV